MEVVAAVVAGQALVFVIAFGSTLAVGWRAVVVAGLVIVFISAFIASVLARGGDGLMFDFSPREAVASALLVGFFLYAGWALGVAAAAWARSWAARRGERTRSTPSHQGTGLFWLNHGRLGATSGSGGVVRQEESAICAVFDG